MSNSKKATNCYPLMSSPCIPVDLAIQVATDLLSNDETLQDRSTIPVDGIVDLLDFCLSTANFKYNNTYYQQIFGTAIYGFSCISRKGKPRNGRPWETSTVHFHCTTVLLETLCGWCVRGRELQPCANLAASFEQYRAIDPVYGWKINKSENIFSGRYCLSSRQRSTFH